MDMASCNMCPVLDLWRGSFGAEQHRVGCASLSTGTLKRCLSISLIFMCVPCVVSVLLNPSVGLVSEFLIN